MDSYDRDEKTAELFAKTSERYDLGDISGPQLLLLKALVNELQGLRHAVERLVYFKEKEGA